MLGNNFVRKCDLQRIESKMIQKKTADETNAESINNTNRQ